MGEGLKGYLFSHVRVYRIQILACPPFPSIYLLHPCVFALLSFRKHLSEEEEEEEEYGCGIPQKHHTLLCYVLRTTYPYCSGMLWFIWAKVWRALSPSHVEPRCTCSSGSSLSLKYCTSHKVWSSCAEVGTTILCTHTGNALCIVPF